MSDEAGLIFDGTEYYVAYNPEPNIHYEIVDSGPRQHAIISCQYWVKGLSRRCAYFVDGDYGSCTYQPAGENDSIPSGWNGGICDCMGRQGGCNKYSAIPLAEGEEDTPSPFMCAAINPFVSGIGKKTDNNVNVEGTDNKMYFLRPLKKSEVKGFNEGDCADGLMGRCDGRGTGRGTAGFGKSAEDMSKLPVVCPYYRPWQMGFGAVQPHKIKVTYDADGNRVITKQAIDEAYDLVDKDLNKQLPFSFKIYNLRPRAQKCKFWTGDPGTFNWDTSGVTLDVVPLDKCTCEDSICSDYITPEEPLPGTDAAMCADVWCKAGTIICNGAKPECPCYTGEWVYCTDKNMQDGNRITARQILELRFWARLWSSQAEYDAYFEARPGTNYDDPTTADLYTFSKWLKLGKKTEDSIMLGTKLHMCQPAPWWDKVFDPEIYIEETEVVYPNYKTGTAAQGTQSFPTLIRDIDDMIGMHQFGVIFPYPNENEATPCDSSSDKPDYYIKRSSNTTPDSISCVGYAEPGTDIYIINDLFVSLPNSLSDHMSVREMKGAKLSSFYTEMAEFVKLVDRNQPKCICHVVVGSDGAFDMGPLDLKYQQMNTIIILANFSDSTWDFTKRKVWSQWYGGVVLQTSFNYARGARGNEPLPHYFSPKASASGQAFPLHGKGKKECIAGVSHTIAAHSRHKLGPTGHLTFYHSYCVGYVSASSVIAKYAIVGNSNKIWGEIDDIRLNYVFRWEITSASISYTNPDGEYVSVDLLVYMGQNLSIPPNAFMLEIPPGNRSIKLAECDINVNYVFYTMEQGNAIDGGTTVWPDYTSNNVKHDGSPFALTANGQHISVGDIGNKTVSLLTFFTDEHGRTISCFATRFMTSVPRVESRSVEMFYAYSQGAKAFNLQPYGGLMFTAGGDSPAGTTSHYNRPHCGDHDTSDYFGYGPVWWPFDTCEDFGWYDDYCGAGICVAPYEGCPRSDMRYCGPQGYVAGATGTMYALYDCGHDWAYSYSAAGGNVRFVGYANLSTQISNYVYSLKGWLHPPFGDTGREFVERWLSDEHMPHLSYKSQYPVASAQWMPIVPDVKNLFLSFNCFDGFAGIDTFTPVSQLNMFVRSDIGEFIDIAYVRSDDDPNILIKIPAGKRFDDVLDNRMQVVCSYPPPIFTAESGQTVVAHFNFKSDYTSWAWCGYLGPVVREVPTGGLESTSEDGVIRHVITFLPFVYDYYLTPYSFDLYKKEHRFTPSEGYHSVHFTSPIIEEGCVVNHAGISLDGGPIRYFNIMYDEYGLELVEFVDIGDGLVDGTEKSEYSESSNTDEWCHDPNSIFEDDDPVDGLDGYVFGWDEEDNFVRKSYRRGITPLIYKNRLHHLPYIETPFELLPTSQSAAWFEIDGFKIFSGVSQYILDVSGDCVEGVFSRLRFELLVGTLVADAGDTFSLPFPCITLEAISVTDGVISVNRVLYDGTPDQPLPTGMASALINITVGSSMLGLLAGERVSTLRLTLNGENYMFSSTKDIELTGYVATFEDTYENIYIPERKYYTSSSSSMQHSLNGPDRYLRPAENNDNAGIYFPFGWGTPIGDKFTARDKMRSAHAGKFLNKKEALTVKTKTQFYSVEANAQKKVYDAATNLERGDSVDFMSVCPPPWQLFFDSIGGVTFPEGVSLRISSEKLYWDKHIHGVTIDQADIWHPGGHKFQHSQNVGYTGCWLGDGPEDYKTIYPVDFVHVGHGGTSGVFDPWSAFYSTKTLYVATKWNRYGIPVDNRHYDFTSLMVAGPRATR